jgi:hypothetical protein
MPMPIAAVNKKHFPAGWEYEVRFAGQSCIVQPEPVAALMQGGTNSHFRQRVSAADSGHEPASM